MEPEVGTSGLPPLLPSAPVPVPVADSEQIVEEVVEPDLCSLTELVPVRSKQLSSAERMLEEEMVDDPLEGQLEEMTSGIQEDAVVSVNPEVKNVIVIQKIESAEAAPSKELVVNATEADTESSETFSESRPESRSEGTSSPAYHVPPHLLGRTVDNPSADIPPGRRTQRPRLGVKVPYRNLTSQIVTQSEIAQEIFERTAKKHPSMVESYTSVVTKVGASIANTEIFTKKLTQRLANTITPPIAKPKTAIVPESMGTLKALLPSKPAAPLADGVRLSPGFTYSEKDKGMDEAELLSILEGEGDPLWLPDKLLRKPENASLDPALAPTPSPLSVQVVAPTNSTSVSPAPVTPQPLQTPPPKLDPAVEKELALKQLMELPIAFPPKKPEKKDKSQEKRARRRGGKVKEEALDKVGSAVETVVDPASTVAEDVIPAIAPVPDNPVQEVVVENGENPENTTPVKKAPSSRKRKITPDVEAVLKKPKVTKKAKAEAETVPKASSAPEAVTKAEVVSNGKSKAKSVSSTSIPSTPNEASKKKPPAGKKVVQPKTEPEVLVANGSPEANGKKKRTSKGKTEESPPAKKAVSKISTPKVAPAKPVPAKPGKSPKAVAKGALASKTPAATLSPKQQKAAGSVSEELVEEPKDQLQNLVEEEAPPTLEPQAQESAVPHPSQPQQKKATRINRELEHLLGDEGAVNMLYAVEGHNKRKVSSKDLALKARLVKTAVMRLSTSPQGHMPLALRARRSLNATEPPKLVKMGGNRKQRHLSSESLDAMRSPPYLTPVDGHTYSPRQKLTADDSRIIRRHSSSSSFSSPSVSPRRVSVEDSNAQIIAAAAAAAASAPGTSGSPRKKGVPIFVPKGKNLTYDGRKKSKVAINPVVLKEQLLELQSKKSNIIINPAALKQKDQRKIISEVNGRVKSELKKLKKGIDSTTLSTRIAKLHKAQLLAKRKAAEELAKAQKAAEELLQVQQEAEELVIEDVATPVIKQEGKRTSAPLSPDASSEVCECTYGACLASCARCVTGPLFCVSPTGYSNLLKSLHSKGKKSNVEERQRSTVRHCAGTYNYKEITVRRYDNIVHIILAPSSTKMSSALNVQVLRELRDALQQVRKDDQCKVVLLTSSGSIFCQGIDISALIQTNNEKRKTAAFEMSLALKDFLKCIAHFPKPVIAGVQGAAVGLGVTMLPLFDMVFASDKATFHTPYSQLGQVPEGGATLTLPYMLGHTATSELLLNCRRLTANEALQFGLVTRVLWPDRFLEELIPVVKNIALQSAQSMEATKALLRHGLRTKFDAALESETHLLVEHWTSKECQTSFQRMLENGEMSLQRQRSVDA